MNKTRAKYKRLLKDGKEVARPYETETEAGTLVAHMWAPKEQLVKSLHEDFPRGAVVVFSNQSFMFAIPGTESDRAKLADLLDAKDTEQYDRFRSFLCAGQDFRVYSHLFKTEMEKQKMQEELAEKEQETIDYAQKLAVMAGVKKVIDHGTKTDQGAIPPTPRGLPTGSNRKPSTPDNAPHASVRARRRSRGRHGNGK